MVFPEPCLTPTCRHRWWILASIPQIARQADEAVRQADTINRAASLTELWINSLDVVLASLDAQAQRYAD